jgi:hypothetical protein
MVQVMGCCRFPSNNRVEELVFNPRFLAGHEASFTAFLCCLFQLNVLEENDYIATVFRIFKRQVHFTGRTF